MNTKILVTGGNGQLGHCFQKLQKDYTDYQFIFTDYDTLDITDKTAVSDFFKNEKPAYCINASAYTAVDLAEQEKDKAFAINAYGVQNLAEACNEFNSVLIHISTDYVFSGETETTYKEDDPTNPLGVYGESKLKGEQLALEYNPCTIVIRTSWLYSEFGKNFVKTMLTLFETKPELNVVADQFGQPTNANNLAEAVMSLVTAKEKTYGIFHFSNYPETNWCEFAKKIAEFSGSSIQINPITTDQYPTPARRPHRSTMSLDKISKAYSVEPIRWELSLEECVSILKP